MERHRIDASKAKKTAGGQDGKKSFSWNREEDFEQRRRFTPQVDTGPAIKRVYIRDIIRGDKIVWAATLRFVSTPEFALQAEHIVFSARVWVCYDRLVLP